MYTKQDLIENQKMNEIIKANKEKMTQHFIKEEKRYIRNTILHIVSGIVFGIGLMVLIAVIENWSF